MDDAKLREIYAKLKPCEKHLILNREPSFFHKCVDEVTGMKWRHTDIIMFDEDGNIVRLLSYFIDSRDFVSVISFYKIVEGEFIYTGYDVDVSDVNDVKLVFPDLVGDVA